MKLRNILGIIFAILIPLALAACAGSAKYISTFGKEETYIESEDVSTAASAEKESDTEEPAESTAETSNEYFTNRDLEQEADLSDAEEITLSDGENVDITSAGVYLISGSAKNATITVSAGDEDKVQLVLDGVSITNDDFPAIYVKNADKVFVTTTDSDNTLSVTGEFRSDGDTNTDAAIFSKDDLVLNGVGTLTVTSSDNGITSKDDLKVTGGTLNISCTSDALEANDSIRIAGGDITIETPKDGLHAEYDEDDTVGYVYISGGTLNVTAGDDAIHATTYVIMDEKGNKKKLPKKNLQ